MSSTELILVRHGESLWNTQHRIQGQKESPLTATGVAQAKAAAERIRGLHVDALYSSDLSRAYDTARCISEVTGLELQVELGLRERAYGIVEGLTWDELREKHPKIYAERRRRDPDYAFSGAESTRKLEKRAINVFESLAQRHPEQSIIAVTHGGVISAFMRHVLGIPFKVERNFHITNTSLTVVEYTATSSRQWAVTTMGDAWHVRQLALTTKLQIAKEIMADAG